MFWTTLILSTANWPAGVLSDARPAMTRMVEGSRAEDGCEGYNYAEDVLDAALIHVKELWRDRAALDRHVASDHIAAWRGAWPSLGIRDRNPVVYTVGEPRPA